MNTADRRRRKHPRPPTFTGAAALIVLVIAALLAIIFRGHYDRLLPPLVLTLLLLAVFVVVRILKIGWPDREVFAEAIRPYDPQKHQREYHWTWLLFVVTCFVLLFSQYTYWSEARIFKTGDTVVLRGATLRSQPEKKAAEDGYSYYRMRVYQWTPEFRLSSEYYSFASSLQPLLQLDSGSVVDLVLAYSDQSRLDRWTELPILNLRINGKTLYDADEYNRRQELFNRNTALVGLAAWLLFAIFFLWRIWELRWGRDV